MMKPQSFLVILRYFFLIGTVVGKCSAGYWCQAGSLSPTPSNETDSNITKAGPCPPGVFCPLGTIVPVGCPNGTFKDYYGGVGSKDDCWPCPAGQECFEGKYICHF